MSSDLENVLIICIESADPATEENFYGKLANAFKSSIYFLALNHSLKSKNQFLLNTNLERWKHRAPIDYKISEAQRYFESLEISTYVYIIHDWDVPQDYESLNQTYDWIKSELIRHNFDECKIHRIYDENQSFDYFLYQITHDLVREPLTNIHLQEFAKKYKSHKDMSLIWNLIYSKYSLNEDYCGNKIIGFLSRVLRDSSIRSHHLEILEAIYRIVTRS